MMARVAIDEIGINVAFDTIEQLEQSCRFIDIDDILPHSAGIA
jgi:hypothetical protein